MATTTDDKQTGKSDTKPAKATAAKTAKSSSRPIKAGRANGWTEEQVQILLDSVKSAPTISAGVKLAAEKLGKKEGAVSQKFYAMKVKSGKRRGRPKAAKSAKPAKPVAQRPIVRPMTGDDAFASQSTADLMALVQRVRNELDRRRKELDAAHSLFN